MPTYYFTISLGWKSGHRVAGFSAPSFLRLKLRSQPCYILIWSSRSFCRLLAEVRSFQPQDWVLICMLAVGQGPFSGPRGYSWFLVTRSSSWYGSLLLQGQWSDLSFKGSPDRLKPISFLHPCQNLIVEVISHCTHQLSTEGEGIVLSLYTKVQEFWGAPQDSSLIQIVCLNLGIWEGL